MLSPLQTLDRISRLSRVPSVLMVVMNRPPFTPEHSIRQFAQHYGCSEDFLRVASRTPRSLRSCSVRSRMTERSMALSAKCWAYSDKPSFSSHSPIRCIATPRTSRGLTTPRARAIENIRKNPHKHTAGLVSPDKYLWCSIRDPNVSQGSKAEMLITSR